jgi:antitoxin ParD1/3/4
MNITLSPDQQAFVQSQIETGHYSSVEDLISEALVLLSSRQQKLAELRQQIAVGTEQIRNGQVTDGEEVFDRLQVKISSLSHPEA